MLQYAEPVLNIAHDLTVILLVLLQELGILFHLVVHLPGVELEVVAAVLLGAVHGDVGVAQQRLAVTEVDVDRDLTIGRRAPADIVVVDTEISSRHVKLSPGGEGILVTDLASTVLGQPGLDVVRTGTPEIAAVAVGVGVSVAVDVGVCVAVITKLPAVASSRAV